MIADPGNPDRRGEPQFHSKAMLRDRFLPFAGAGRRPAEHNTQRGERSPPADRTRDGFSQSALASTVAVPDSGGRQTLRFIVPSMKVRLDVQLDSLSSVRFTLHSGLSAQIRKQ